MKVIIASDKFKGSLTAAQVSDALRRGIQQSAPEADVIHVPVADGGDGSLDAALAAGFTRCPVTVTGPTGAPVRTAYARSGLRAVVELADASGLARLPSGPAPMAATTMGTGEVVAAAVDAGCREIILGVGGSSSTDGGAGLVVGLGARVLDARGDPVPPGGGGLPLATTLDLEPVRRRLAGVRVVLASDVDNPLLGPSGAAAVYAPQKGASLGDIARMERGLTIWADLVTAATGRDLRNVGGAGAAGGAGFAALSLLGAEMHAGVDTFLALSRFDEIATGATLVITGEGSLDEQSLRGKAPIGVLRAALRLDLPVVAVCGRTTLPPEALSNAGFQVIYSLIDREPDPTRSMTEAARLLEAVGAELGALISQTWGEASARSAS